MKSGRKYSSVGHGIVLLVLILCAAASEASANLDRYRDLIVADGDRSAAPPRKGVRVTYLGTNGYLLESQETKILIDPYFTRVNLFRAALNLRVASDRSVIERWLPSRSVAAILVTHGHFDHLLDASEVAMLSGAKLIASATSTQLARSVGVPGNRCIPVESGDVVRVGEARVKVLSARHDRLICRVPFNGPPRRIPPRSM
ncbi:MAG TPA: MBL fold metallo-hydrolase, partial [Terrimicrobiaceae bacterium]